MMTQRLDLLSSEFARFKTAPAIIDAIQAGAVAWVTGLEIPTVESLRLPDSLVGQLVAQAYSEQTQLGWNVLFRGFLTDTWRFAQDAHLKTIFDRGPYDTGESWSGKAHCWIFDLFEILWELRNADEHGTDRESQNLIRLTKCERAIRRLYHQGSSLPYGERHPFRTDIDELLAQSVKNQELWISKTEDYLPKAFRRTRKRDQNRQSAMTDFYGR
jgi:hypothetical protein